MFRSGPTTRPLVLAACFYSRNLARSGRAGDAPEAGIVGVAEGALAAAAAAAPFGGVKASGHGREDPAHSLQNNQRLEHVCHGGLN